MTAAAAAPRTSDLSDGGILDEVQGRLGVFFRRVSQFSATAALDGALQVALREGLECLSHGWTARVWEQQRRVDDVAMHEAQSAEIVLQAVAYEDGIGRDD